MGTANTTDRREKRALDLYVKLVRASTTLTVQLHAPLQAESISESHFGVLDALAHLGSMTQRELGTKILRSPGNMTGVLDQLEKRGWVTRERGEDRRSNRIALTAEGRKVFERIFPAHAKRLADAVSVLTAHEQDELARLCRKLGLALSGEDGGKE